MDTSIQQPTSVNSASMLFNATPVGTDFTHTGTNTYAYVVTNGQVGGINVPAAAPGNVVQVPSSIAWLPSSTTGSLTFQYLNPTTSTRPAGGRCLERHRRRHLDPAVHAAVRERSESRAADALSQGLFADRRPDRPGAGARAGHRSGLGRRDRGRRHRPAVPPPPADV